MIVLWMLLAVDGGCPKDSTLSAVRDLIGEMAESVQRRDVDAFAPLWTDASGRVECLTDVVHPRDAAGLHAARYLNYAVTDDKSGMAFALRAMLDVPGGGGAPAWLTVPEGAEIANPSEWVPVSTPEHVVLFVDGVPMTSRPLDRPAIYQAVGAGAEVLWTHYLDGGQELPSGFVLAEPPPASNPEDGRALLDQVTTLLSDGSFQKVIDLSLPAVSAHPELADSFRAAADLAADQLDRERNPVPISQFGVIGGSPGYRPVRLGAAKRGDEREGLLLGFEIGLPTAVRVEYKIGGTAVDSVGFRVGGNLLLTGSSSAYNGVDVTIYTDANLTKRYQIELMTGLFFDPFGSPYLTAGAAVQYDPPSPLQINMGLRVATSGYIAPELTVGFVW
ncbi:MAG: hypothetical protein ACI9MC_002061 [Kiritimatiellia bacterium]|jgi:hypothetical protein